MNKNKNIVICVWLVILHAFFTSINAWHCNLISVGDACSAHPEISYLHCHDAIPFEYQKLPVVEDHFLHPYQGFFHRTFILNIPNGQVLGSEGYVLVDDRSIYELIWQNCYLHAWVLESAQRNPIVKVQGKVAVIAQWGYFFYYHWLAEALGRLALLELHGVEYDYLYIPVGVPYIKQSLELWGVDSAKIIEAPHDQILQADELIVPSLVASVHANGSPRLVHYMPQYLIKYIKDKLMHSVDFANNPFGQNKKIFISRKDAGARKMLNEDDVFALFEAQGFEKYVLSSLSLQQQMQLFNSADIVVGALGSGMANLLFCKDDVRVIEIFQARRDCTIYFLCQTLGLSYTCIKTQDFIDANDGQYDTIVPLEVIEDVIKNL